MIKGFRQAKNKDIGSECYFIDEYDEAKESWCIGHLKYIDGYGDFVEHEGSVYNHCIVRLSKEIELSPYEEPTESQGKPVQDTSDYDQLSLENHNLKQDIKKLEEYILRTARV